jgi:hypothetical protein
MAEVAAAPEPDAAPGEPLPPSGAEDALPSLPSSDAHEDAPAPPVDAMAPEALDEAVAAAIQEAARASPREEPTEPAAAPAAAPEASGAAAEEAVAEPADELSRLRARVEQLEAEKKAMLVSGHVAGRARAGVAARRGAESLTRAPSGLEGAV